MWEKARKSWDVVLLGGIILLLCGLVAVLAFREPEEVPVARTTTGYGWLHEEQVVVTAAGDDGAATGSQDSDGAVRGHLYAVHLDFGSAVTATTDVTVSLSSPALTVLALTDYYTDTWYYPVVEETDSSGTGTSTYGQTTVSGALTVEAGESDAGTVVTATVWWGE